jgi:hypothetical protein
MKDQSFLDKLREAIVTGSEHEIYFMDEAGGTVLLYYDLSDKNLRNQISRCLWVNGASIQMYAERQGISFEAAREKINEQHAAIIEELAREKRGQLKELIEDTVRQAIYDFWIEVRGEAQEKSIVRQPGDVWRFTRKGIVKLQYKRGVVEKKSIGRAGAPAGKYGDRNKVEQLIVKAAKSFRKREARLPKLREVVFEINSLGLMPEQITEPQLKMLMKRRFLSWKSIKATLEK